MKTKQLRRYEIWVPMHFYSVYYVEAKDAHEAFKKLDDCDQDGVEENCQVPCRPGCRKSRLMGVKNIERRKNG